MVLLTYELWFSNHSILRSAIHIIAGDTANKIGTYNLAVSAMHHGIPFYVAAPLTSVDLSLSSGQEIVIEERSPKELLHTQGGLGEQVAASGISVWNPAFDVTPAKLISGIITEKVSLLIYLSFPLFCLYDSCIVYIGALRTPEGVLAISN